MSYEALFEYLCRNGQNRWAESLRSASSEWLSGHGDYRRWSQALGKLPSLHNIEAVYDQAAVTVEGECEDSAALREALRGLMPWRKGPYRIAEVYIDCEWRSDNK